MLRENCRILHYQNVLLGSAVLAALTFGFVSCADDSGDNDVDGDKWEATLTNTNVLTATTGNSRGFTQISTNDYTAGITVNIKVDTSTTTTFKRDNAANAATSGASAGAYSGYAAYGWIFGYVDHVDTAEDGTTTTNKKLKDFYLLSVKPGANAYYLERYEGVPKDALENNGSTSSLQAYGDIYSYIGTGTSGSWTKNVESDGTDDNSTPVYKVGTTTNDEYYISGVNDGEWTVSITQKTAGTWVVKINDTQVASFKPSEVGNKNYNTITAAKSKYGFTTTQKLDTTTEYVCGGTAVYGMATYGTQLNATYTVDKDNASTIIKGNYNVKSPSIE